ncbi:MAG: glycosyltransferase family 4 protein [Clostridiaceae bacterium]|jgi:glycosyltransferase involved in cell wall biosynthesis|nr:glycosyltransferase family 4 protein [Clostridiaceae bacterium]
MKSNLLIITPDFPDSTDTYVGGIFIKNFVDTVRSHFSEIVVVAPVLFSGKLIPNDRLCKDYQYDNVSVYYPRCLFLPRCLHLPGITNRAKLSFDTRPYVVERLLRKLGKKFDLIHAHFTWPSAYIGVMLKEKLKIPVITTIHEDPAWLSEEDNMNHPLVQKAWLNADALLRANTYDVSTLQNYNVNVYRVPNGFSTIFRPIDRTACRRALGLPEDRRIVLSVGNLEIIKGHRYLLSAIKSIISEHPDLLCIIVGNGPQKAALEQQIIDEGLFDHVMLAGNKPHTEIPLWMNACDLFVLPSLNESFGIVQIEAMACGKPVIATNTPGSREIIASDKLGLFCQPENEEELAEKIRMGLQMDWDREEILQFAEKFSWEKVAGDILRVYDTAIHECHGLGRATGEIVTPIPTRSSSRP